MRTLSKNWQRIFFATYSGETPIYEKDASGNVVTMTINGKSVYVETGDTQPSYTAPTEIRGNIALQGGNAEAQEFGLNLSDYSAVLVTDKNAYDITEESIIWHETVPVVNNGVTDDTTADYTVIKVAPSLNYDRYVLRKRVK